jgi:hypothetical protein
MGYTRLDHKKNTEIRKHFNAPNVVIEAEKYQNKG